MKCPSRLAVSTVLVLVSIFAIAQVPRPLHLGGDISGTHDPSIAHEGKTYYVFATGKAPRGGFLPIRCSQDLTTWRPCGHVFDKLPDWVHQRSPDTHDLWAPDISFSHGEFRLYYAYSLFGKNTSGIGIATNRTLDSTSSHYKWVDRGLVLLSKTTDTFNAIDPNYIQDAEGHAWLAYGSFWSGIQLRALDASTGMLAPGSKPYLLAARPNAPEAHAIEAPTLIAHDGFYYLFASEGFCCRGAQSTYRVVVGRSRSIRGPYIDRDDLPMLRGGGTLVLHGNQRWSGPGGQSILPNKNLIVFHAYDAVTGHPSLQISPLVWSDGWPQAALGTE